MENRSIWEQENQELLREWCYDQVEYGGMYYYEEPIRQIVCEGCGKVFYTQVKIKKYCNRRCAQMGFWKRKREARMEKRKDIVCKSCGKTFTPRRADAQYCCNACRQKAYRQSVQNNGGF